MDLSILLNGVAQFAAYFFAGLFSIVLFTVVYGWITPQNEWQLIKEGQNQAAAIAFGGSIIGFALALSGVISNAVSFVDFLIWVAIALLAQALAFALVRFVFMPKIVERIEQGEVSAGIMAAVVSIAVGLVNAASMTY